MSPNFCRFSHVCSVASLLLVHTFQRLYLGKEGSHHSCSPLHVTGGCFGLFLTLPISHSFSCAPPSIPIQIPTVTVMQCRCWRSGLFLVVLKVSCNSKLPRLTFRQLLLYLSSIWICCGHWETSLGWMEQRVCLGPYDFVCSKRFEYSKSQHPACSCQISKEKKNHPEILRLMKSPKFIQW